MPSQPFDSAPPQMTRRTLLGCLGIAGLAGTGLLWRQRPNHWRPGFTVHCLPMVSPIADLDWLPGVQWTLLAHLATLAPSCVVSVARPDLRLPAERRAFQLEIHPTRQGELLSLAFRWRRLGGTWNDLPGKPLAPAQAISTFLAALPEHYVQDQQARLLPRSPELAWELFSLASTPRALSKAAGMRARLESLVAAAPDCALGWQLFGHAAHQELWTRNKWTPEDRALAESCLKQSLQIQPNLPVAAGELAQMYSDFGEHGAALAVLSRAIHGHPNSEVLLSQLSYSARNAGLLDVAHHALLKREAWIGHLSGIENTLLYLGEIARFEEGILTHAQAEGWIPAQRFFMGYAALLRGDHSESLRRLRVGGNTWGESRFGRLGYALWTFLEGRMQESIEALETLAKQHLSLHAPDGEFMMKLAEMMALQGKDQHALDMATRAATHGFGCVQWYEQSPLLASVRGFPRFGALLNTLKERQASQADHYPLSAFGF